MLMNISHQLCARVCCVCVSCDLSMSLPMLMTACGHGRVLCKPVIFVHAVFQTLIHLWVWPYGPGRSQSLYKVAVLLNRAAS